MSKKVINLFDNRLNKSGENTNYSELMEGFIGPFKDEFIELFDSEEALMFAIKAWNLGNLNELQSKEAFESILKLSIEDNSEKKLLSKLIQHKIENFKNYDRFITDFNLVESGSEVKLTMYTQDKESYLDELDNMSFDDFDDEDYDDDLEEAFEENFIDRNAVILSPKQPFYDWINNLEDGNSMSDETNIDGAKIYLIEDDIEDALDLKKWLRKKFDKFFTRELDCWCSNKKEWPQKRNFKMFNEWFHVSWSTAVFDTEEWPIVKHDKYEAF